jgi:Zn-dependent protease
MLSGPSFRVAGIPVRIDLTFLMMAFLLGWGARTGGLLLAWMVIVTASVLLHELGHAFAFRRFGQEPQILLQGLGGLTSGTGEPLPPRRDIVVSLAGPLTGLVLVGLPAFLINRSTQELSSDARTILSDLVFVNVGWAVLNLLPILPLDGGRVSAALFSLRSADGARQAHMLSAVVAAAGALVAVRAGYPFGAVFAGFFCAYNVSQLSARRNFGLEQKLTGGWRALARGDTDAARAAAQAVLADRPSARVITQARELLAWARFGEGDTAGAQEALQRLPHGTRPNPFLRATLHLDGGRVDEALDDLVAGYAARDFPPATPATVDLVVRAGLLDRLLDRLLAPGGPGPSAVAVLGVHLHATHRFEEATVVGERALESGAENPDRIAYNLACSRARAGDEVGAIGWLERAVELGFDDVELLDNDSDLASVRREERFQSLLRRVRQLPGGTTHGGG